ncbi:MAG: tripartite tricarboxylate transporter substrate-binding protein, partial [Burkholderiaceae bacterium]
GYPASDFTFWVGLFAPAKTPRDIIARVNQDVTKALQSPEVRERFAILGAEPLSMKPEEFEAFVASEIEVSGKLVKAAGIKVN